MTEKKRNIIIVVVVGWGLLTLIAHLTGVIPESEFNYETSTSSYEREKNDHIMARVNLTQLIKERMHDPSSFDFVGVRYRDEGNNTILTITFRGKNAFGGTVKNYVTAKADSNGNIVEIISEGY